MKNIMTARHYVAKALVELSASNDVLADDAADLLNEIDFRIAQLERERKAA